MSTSHIFFSPQDQAPIHYQVWEPPNAPEGLLLIAHGMLEFIGRYDDFAKKISAHGWLVFGPDHRGHGATGSAQGLMGHWRDQDAPFLLADDLHALALDFKAKYPGLPLLLLGHSMGSFLARDLIGRKPQSFDGVILSGTGDDPRWLLHLGKALACFLSKHKGPRAGSALLDFLVLGQQKRAVKNRRTDEDWLSHDPKVVDAYIQHPWTRFSFSCQAYKDFFSLLLRMDDPAQLAAIPKDLPLLLISGDEDPVGDMGKALPRLLSRYQKLGLRQLLIKQFPQMRHEVLNEVGREEVYLYLLAALTELKRQHSAKKPLRFQSKA